MPRIILALFSLLVFFALGAPSALSRSGGNTATYEDRVGDAPAGQPDITSIVVSNDDKGWLTFKIKVVGFPITQRNDWGVLIDFDANELGRSGDAADHQLDILAAAPDPVDQLWFFHFDEEFGQFLSLGPRGYFPLNGANPDEIVNFSVEGDTLTVNLDSRLLLVRRGRQDYQAVARGKFLFQRWQPPAGFRFWVASGRPVGERNDGSPDKYLYDFGAPSYDGTGSFDYEIKVPPPVPWELTEKAFLLKPKFPQAGKVFAAVLRLGRSDDLGPPDLKSVTCKAALGGAKPLKLQEKKIFPLEGRVRCAWVLPKDSKGKLLKGFISASGGEKPTTITRSFSLRVK